MAAIRDDSIGRYELLIELGRGGMAELFLGRLHGAGGFAKLVAIKRILPHLAQDAQFKEMFLDEGRIAAHLSHPNVCQVFELEQTADDELFLAMEYLDGVSWDHLIATTPRMRTLHLTTGVIGQAAEGLHYAHTLRDVEGRPTPVIHRDVSPQNLFVTVDGVCKVLDFGVSKMMTDGPRTRSGVIKGKLPYMAPEQIRGEDVDARADVFALGVCTWEALATARLFERATDFQIWKAVTEEDVPPIARHWPECPPAVEAVVRRALDRDRARRQPSARAFAEELRAAAGGAASIGEIAEAVRTQCGDRIAARARQVATAVTARRGATADRDAAATIDEAVSMQLRQHSLKVERPIDGAAATRDLRSRSTGATAASTTELDAAQTVPRTSNVAVLERDAAVTVDDKARARVEVDESIELPVRHGPRWVALLVVLAVVAAVVLVIATRRDRSPVERPPAPRAPATPPAAIDLPIEREGELGGRFSGVPNLRRLGDDLRQLKRELKGEPATAGTGFYTIDSTPHATVYVDGKRIGITPLSKFSIAAGPHEVRAVLEDGRSRTFKVTIAAESEFSSGTLRW